MNEDNGQIIQENSHEPSHYAMIPKMAMMDLDPYELVLYCHYKMTASENGKCWKSNKTLATETGMSVRRLQEARDTLATKGFITLTYAPDESGNINTPPLVTIVSVWSENRSRYAKKDASPMHSVHTPLAPDASPHALSAAKEYPMKKNSKSSVPQQTVKQQKQSMIDAWFISMGFDTFDIGADRYLQKRMLCAGRMLLWSIPPTIDEIKRYCESRKENTPMYEFTWLENDLAKIRLERAKAEVKPPPTKQADPLRPEFHYGIDMTWDGGETIHDYRTIGKDS